MNPSRNLSGFIMKNSCTEYFYLLLAKPTYIHENPRKRFYDSILDRLWFCEFQLSRLVERKSNLSIFDDFSKKMLRNFEKSSPKTEKNNLTI